MCQTAIKLQIKVEDLYDRWGWDLYEKFEHAFDAFRIA
jgi:translation initiation factor 2 alpha subunit (eIF-2alpha)